MQKKVTAEDLEIEVLHRDHERIIAKFETDTAELKEFLVEDAIRNQEWLISKTFLWFLKPKKELAGYITFMTDAIKIKGTYLQPFFNKKGIIYPYIPALKIGRLCVDKRFEGSGIGTKMVLFAMKTSIGLNDMASCRFITVDAKRNEGALNLYKKRGFLVLKETTGDTEPLFFDVMNVERYLESPRFYGNAEIPYFFS